MITDRPRRQRPAGSRRTAAVTTADDNRRHVRAEMAATLRLAGPLVATNLAQTGMTATDVMFMGWLGPEQLAAGALGTNVYFPFVILGIGFMSAIAPMIAAELGARAHSVREVRRTARQGFWAALIIAAPAMAILWNAEAILLAFGQAPNLAAQAASYVRTLMWSLPFFLLFVALRAFVSALQRPGVALTAVLVAFLVNALANWALIFGRLGAPALGLPGSGLATTIACVCMFAVIAIFATADRRMRRYHVFGRVWRPDWPRLRELTRLGLPLGLTLVFEVSVFNAAVFLMGIIGADSLAAHAIAIQIASLTFMAPLGIAHAASVRVGLAYGARDMAAVRRAGWIAFWLGTGAMALTAVAMIGAPRLLISPFLDVAAPANARVVELATQFLAIAALFQLADGAQATGSGMLRGLHDTRVPMIYALIGYWGIGVPAGVLLAFPLGWAGHGVWTGLALALTAVAALMLRRWSRLTARDDPWPRSR
ncbi:MAG: MATE family efflux transporter [Methylobacteriaceae bacterium]|nr:MATE family efflux transporter [Methylobacteriaceae bacterium]